MSYLTKCSMNLEKFATSNSNFTVYKYFYRRKIFEPETELIEKKKRIRTRRMMHDASYLKHCLC